MGGTSARSQRCDLRLLQNLGARRDRDFTPRLRDLLNLLDATAFLPGAYANEMPLRDASGNLPRVYAIRPVGQW